MNKLVSKNSVLRFKQGKLIYKFLNSGRIGYFLKDGTPIKKTSLLGITLDYENPITKESIPENQVQEVKYKRIINNGKSKFFQGLDGKFYYFDGREITPSKYISKSKEDKKVVNPGGSRSYKNKRSNSTQSSSPLFYGIAIGGKVRNDRLNYITDAQKQKLINTGKFKDSDFNTVTDFQTALNNYFVGDPEAGSIKVDNLWGDQTEKAFNFALEKADTPIAGNLNTTPVIQTTPILEVKIAPTIQNLPPTATKTYNRSLTRDYMRDLGLNPYDYTGAERKALRMYLNGTGDDKDKVIAQNIIDIPQFTTYTPSSDFTKNLTMLNTPLTLKYNMKFEKGGLISKNSVLRFKQGKLIVKALSGIKVIATVDGRQFETTIEQARKNGWEYFVPSKQAEFNRNYPYDRYPTEYTIAGPYLPAFIQDARFGDYVNGWEGETSNNQSGLVYDLETGNLDWLPKKVEVPYVPTLKPQSNLPKTIESLTQSKSNFLKNKSGSQKFIKEKYKKISTPSPVFAGYKIGKTGGLPAK